LWCMVTRSGSSSTNACMHLTLAGAVGVVERRDEHEKLFRDMFAEGVAAECSVAWTSRWQPKAR
jgi:hypothetical protein